MHTIHQLKDWPDFRWDEARLIPLLGSVRHEQGLLLGQMSALGFSLRAEAGLANLTAEIVQSSAIEGEKLHAGQVRSSIARRLGLDAAGLPPATRHVDGLVEMMLDATGRFAEPLTARRLFSWHAALFPTGRSGLRDITVAGWRKPASDPMQVVSGPIGREKIHFEAPVAARLPAEMKTFLKWFNSPPATDPVLKAALAHFWLVTLHPFEDGNGRIARAVADMALARSERCPDRFYSMSAQIEVERNAYYDVLESSQKGTLDITTWLTWFLGCLGRAMTRARSTLAGVLRKARIWELANEKSLHPRQRMIITRLLDDFQGHLNNSKYAKIAKCSPDTALRDILDLVNRQVLVQNAGGGRSTSYRLREPPPDQPVTRT